MRRHVDRRDDVARQDPAEALAQVATCSRLSIGRDEALDDRLRASPPAAPSDRSPAVRRADVRRAAGPAGGRMPMLLQRGQFLRRVDVAEGGLVGEVDLDVRSGAYQRSILRSPRGEERLQVRAGATRRTSAKTGCGWSPVRATARSAPSACAAPSSRATRSCGKERRVAGHGDDPLGLGRLQARVKSGKRAGIAVDRVRHHRMPESPVVVLVAVGVDQQRRRPAARAVGARARPSARRGSATRPLSMPLPPPCMRRARPPARTSPVMPTAAGLRRFGVTRPHPAAAGCGSAHAPRAAATKRSRPVKSR